jgi:hypothetical protein
MTMERGEAALAMNYRKVLTWLAGSSWLELFFQKAGDPRKQWLMKPGMPSPAARCGGCGGVWLALPLPAR